MNGESTQALQADDSKICFYTKQYILCSKVNIDNPFFVDL